MPQANPPSTPTPRDQSSDGIDLNPGGQKGPDPRRNPGGQKGQGRPGEQQQEHSAEAESPDQLDR